MYVYVYMYIYMCVYLYMYIYMHIYVYIHIYISKPLEDRPNHRRKNMYIYINVYVCIYVYIYVYTHMYTYFPGAAGSISPAVLDNHPKAHFLYICIRKYIFCTFAYIYACVYI